MNTASEIKRLNRERAYAMQAIVRSAGHQDQQWAKEWQKECRKELRRIERAMQKLIARAA